MSSGGGSIDTYEHCNIDDVDDDEAHNENNNEERSSPTSLASTTVIVEVDDDEKSSDKYVDIHNEHNNNDNNDNDDDDNNNDKNNDISTDIELRQSLLSHYANEDDGQEFASTSIVHVGEINTDDSFFYESKQDYDHDNNNEPEPLLFDPVMRQSLFQSYTDDGQEFMSTATSNNTVIGNILNRSLLQQLQAIYDDEEEADTEREAASKNNKWTNKIYAQLNHQITTNRDRIRKLVERLSDAPQSVTKTISSVIRKLPNDILPTTTQGWIALLSCVGGLAVWNERRLQKRLTQLPHIYGQITNPDAPIAKIFQQMTLYEDGTNNHIEDSIAVVNRPMKPSLGIGTRPILASMAAYLAPGPPREYDKYMSFREELILPADGTTIAIDWELPTSDIIRQLKKSATSYSYKINMTNKERKEQVLKGPIEHPVIIIVHGINNDSSFGYIRSLMRSCTNHGWITIGYNFRGCGGTGLSTPRGYNGGYTGDLRGTIQIIEGRLAPNTPLFLVGNSLGANLVAKYLGEEGASGTLPKCIAGGITLGNPMSMNEDKMDPVSSAVIAAGAKLGLLQNYKYFKHMNTFHYKQALYNVFFKAITLKDFDTYCAPIFIRNENEYPFQWQFGYDTPDDYWTDCSSSRVISFVTVPLLQLIAQDDFIVYAAHHKSMSKNISNPNIMVIETIAGGHLGWQETAVSTPLSDYGVISSMLGQSWADAATAQFIQAVIDVSQSQTTANNNDIRKSDDDNDDGARNKSAHVTGQATTITISLKYKDSSIDAPILRSKL